MGLVVQKFGGTSVEGPERLKAAARRLVAARDAGNSVVGNRGDTLGSGGVVLVTSPFSHKGSSKNLVAFNKIKRNSPAYIVLDGGSKKTTFMGNHCKTSKPRGHC